MSNPGGVLAGPAAAQRAAQLNDPRRRDVPTHPFWLRRARCKGAARQQLEQLGMVCLYNALVWRANQRQLAPPDDLASAA